jgi:hypothetical protein
MTYRGDIGLVMPYNVIEVSRSVLTIPVQPTGNGPISNSAPYLATPGSVINLNGRRGAQMDRVAGFANPSGIWSFYDLSPGTYFATEAGVSRQWQIDVAADLSFTVTPITSSFPVNASSGYVA